MTGSRALPRLAFSGLEIGYGRQRIAGPLEACWEGGHVWVLTGPNGSGKTTLLRTLLGFLPPLAGKITGLEQERLSYVPQIAAFDTGFPVTCSEVVSTGLAGRRTRKDRQRRIADALEQVQLAQHAQAPFFRLSGGQRQRVLIARAISAEAPVIALDEPTVGVDAASCTQVWQLLQQLGRSGKLVLVVTHDLFRAPEYSDRLLTLDGGCLSERRA